MKRHVMSFLTRPIRSLRTRILVLFVVLMLLVQFGGFVVINTIGVTAARETVGAEIVAGARVFDRLLEQNTQRLVEGARLLTADYAFREAVATEDRATIASVLANHGKRIDAAVMMLVALDRRVIVDTLDVDTGRRFAFPGLLDEAEASHTAAAMVLIRGQLYRLVIVPVLAPLPIAWVAVGFRVNDTLAQDLNHLTRLQVSFLSRQVDDDWRIQASTLPGPARAALLADMVASRFAASDSNGNALYGDETVTRAVSLSTRANGTVTAVLQQPLSLALEPFRRLQRQLTLIASLGVVFSIIASIVIAGGIARPVRDLAAFARRIAAGDYSTMPPALRQDEIGDLAAAFRSMQDGIAMRESRITDLAYRDALTGLPNRVLYADRLEQALASSGRTGTPLTVLLMDLDHFKDVNDSLGHPIGDLLLQEVAARLQAVVRRATDTVARLGGDEFAILLPGDRESDAHRVAEAMLRVLEVPMMLEGHMVDIRASIGIASCPIHGTESSKLLRRADVAMYAAKRNNLGVAMWDDRYEKHNLERLSLMSDLRKAVDNDELALVYQPKVSLRSTGEHFVEALVRWQHPVRGLVPPAEFIPFAEQTGYIRAITQWVIEHAVAQCAEWRRRGLPTNVSINISARDLMDGELPDRFAALLKREGCAVDWISFEITESAILDDPGHAINNLGRLHALGCKLAIDDYGTGYSSLAYLSRLTVDELKIDKSFVMGMAKDASDAIIVRSTIELAHNMGLTVIAEGVENEATFEQLSALGCDTVQGYWISKPITATEAEVWMRESVWTSAARQRSGLRRIG